jgi:hypothetical protein
MKTHKYILLLLLLVFVGNLESPAQEENPNRTFINKHQEYPKLAVKLELLTGPGIIIEPTIIDNLTLGLGVGTRMVYSSNENLGNNRNFVYNPKLFLEGRYYFKEWIPDDASFISRVYDGAYVGLHLATSLDKSAFDKNDNCVLVGVQKSFLKRLYANLGVGVWLEKSNGATQFDFKVPLGLGLILF